MGVGKPDITTDVAIVGAGPTGLTLALTLRRAGIDCVVIEPNLAIAPESRANLMHAGSLERLAVLGVVDDIMTRGIPVTRSELHRRSKTLAVNDWSRIDSAFPMVLMIRQNEIEETLEKHVDASQATVLRGQRLTAFSQGEAMVDLTCESASGASNARSRFLVGCDGATSFVRRHLGTRFDATRLDETYLTADVRLCRFDDRSASHLFLDPRGPLVLSPLPGGIHSIGGTVPDDFTPSIGAIETLLEERAGLHAGLDRLEASATYHVRSGLAQRSVVGRVILAGDAAHTHSPVGGQGMNLGIADAFELGTRLASVISGQKGPQSLAEYERVRRAEAERVQQTTQRTARLVLATGAKRVIADSVVRLAGRIDKISDRLTVEMSGIHTPWPPGVVVPERRLRSSPV